MNNLIALVIEAQSDMSAGKVTKVGNLSFIRIVDECDFF